MLHINKGHCQLNQGWIIYIKLVIWNIENPWYIQEISIKCPKEGQTPFVLPKHGMQCAI
jgi:hypothetical protein